MIAHQDAATGRRQEPHGRSVARGRNSDCQGDSTGPLGQAGLYGATRSGPAYLAAAYFPRPRASHESDVDGGAGHRDWALWRERAGIAEGTFVRYPAAANWGDTVL
jgi:hypothetical protein